MDDGSLTGLSLVARAHDDLFNYKIIGGRAEVWIY
jgi:hypothetical protein